MLLFLSRSITFNITFGPKISFTFTIPGAIGGRLMFNPSTLVVRISSSFSGLSNELQSSSCDTASGIKHHIKGVRRKNLLVWIRVNQFSIRCRRCRFSKTRTPKGKIIKKKGAVLNALES